MSRWSLALGALVLALGSARADDLASLETTIEPPPPPAEPDWSSAPRADQASGIEQPEATPVREHLLWIPRGILFVPRWTVWAVAQPVRGAAYAYEHYALQDRYKRALFNVDQTFGVYPTATYETGYGINAGLRLVHYDLFGEGERLKLGASLGGRYRRSASMVLRSGKRFGDRVALELDARYERRIDRFYGYGNADVAEAPPAEPLDPTAGGPAYATRFQEDLDRVVATADTRLTGPLALRTSGAYMHRSFVSATNTDDDLPIADVFDTALVPGFRTGVDTVYVEGELSYDTRRPASDLQSQVIDATGWLVSAFLGGATGVAGDRSQYLRYGGEVQRYIDLYRGSRVLAVRALVEAVAGPDDRIAFVDLPRLGGNEDLRGYPTGRFRDRAIALATLEYTWDLGNFFAAYAFVDAGRPLPSLRDPSLDELRVGFGGGVQLHTRTSFLTRAQVAGSRDGDVFLELVVSPAFGRRERAGRY